MNSQNYSSDKNNNIRLWNNIQRLKEMSQGSMEFQGPQIAPKVEWILGFHWLIVLYHLHSVIGAKYDN
jgi:hypothetical protein